MQGGMGEFYGYRERVYRGKKKPEEFIAKYTQFNLLTGETINKYYDRYIKLMKDKNFDPELYCKTNWKIDWKNLLEYNGVYYPHSSKGMTEITKEEVERLTNEI